MERLIHTALNAIANARDTRVITAQNLANQTVPGFRRDLPNEGGTYFLTALNAASARAFQLETSLHRFSADPGALNETGEPLDVAIADNGYFFVLPQSGEPALTRRGDLHRSAAGELLNGAGEKMLDPEMRPLVVAPFKAIQINELGQVIIEPMNGAPGVWEQAGMLATVVPQNLPLRKYDDGQIRPVDGPLPVPDQKALVRQGFLEASNVNTIEELLQTIEFQRAFELGIKMIAAAKQNDEAGARLMRMPEG